MALNLRLKESRIATFLFDKKSGTKENLSVQRSWTRSRPALRRDGPKSNARRWFPSAQSHIPRHPPADPSERFRPLAGNETLTIAFTTLAMISAPPTCRSRTCQMLVSFLYRILGGCYPEQLTAREKKQNDPNHLWLGSFIEWIVVLDGFFFSLRCFIQVVFDQFE
jgi:hypothetical protein